MSTTAREMLPRHVAVDSMHVLLGLPVRHVAKQGNSSGPGTLNARYQPMRELICDMAPSMYASRS